MSLTIYAFSWTSRVRFAAHKARASDGTHATHRGFSLPAKKKKVDIGVASHGRADCGEQLIERLAVDLTKQFDRGFGNANLWRMQAFFLAWPEDRILATVLRESSNSTAINAIREKPEARNFYEAEALRAGWTVRQLDRQISSQFYEHIALSKNKAAMLEKAQTPEPSDAITPEEAIKDPFVLEFLDLKDEYSESDMEEALIQHLADFLLELGDDFAFVGRQRRLRLDDNWFRVDLVFFHRRLRCLLLADLKIGKFSYADAGQMHLYLNYAREHWTKPARTRPSA